MRYFQLQPEYRGKQTITCNIQIQLNGNVLTAYLSKYGSVEAVTPLKASDRTAHGDYIITVCLDKDGFQAIPHMISYEQQQMMVVVEGRTRFVSPVNR